MQRSPEFKKVFWRAATVIGLAAGSYALIGDMAPPGAEQAGTTNSTLLPEVDCLEAGVNPTNVSQQNISLEQASAGIENMSFVGDGFSNQTIWNNLNSGLDEVRGNTPVGKPYTKSQEAEEAQLWN